MLQNTAKIHYKKCLYTSVFGSYFLIKQFSVILLIVFKHCVSLFINEECKFEVQSLYHSVKVGIIEKYINECKSQEYVSNR